MQENITHKHIYDRLMAVEKKVDDIDTNTKGLVEAFEATKGAFIVLGWLAQAAKPILWLTAAAAIVYGSVEHIFKK
jgi:hypothetical protein